MNQIIKPIMNWVFSNEHEGDWAKCHFMHDVKIGSMECRVCPHFKGLGWTKENFPKSYVRCSYAADHLKSIEIEQTKLENITLAQKRKCKALYDSMKKFDKEKKQSNYLHNPEFFLHTVNGQYLWCEYKRKTSDPVWQSGYFCGISPESRRPYKVQRCDSKNKFYWVESIRILWSTFGTNLQEFMKEKARELKPNGNN